MTTVDVNTGGFVGVRNFEDTIFKTKLEAAQAVARQLRLRNLGGIIIVDFIDMDNPEHKQAVLDELSRALENDRTRTTTALGTVSYWLGKTDNLQFQYRADTEVKNGAKTHGLQLRFLHVF
jgi:Rne/Rng family ribonuclease